MLDSAQQGGLEIVIVAHRSEDALPGRRDVRLIVVGPAQCRADAVLPLLAPRDHGPRAQPEPSRLDALPDIDEGMPDHQHVRARHLLGDPALFRARDQVVDEHPDPTLRSRPDLAQHLGQVVDAVQILDDDALDPQIGSPDLLDQLRVVTALDEDAVSTCDPRALSLARRFPSRRDSREDLAQVARIGLLNAIDRFDPNRNRPFVAFARPTILGELKRHVRDHPWDMGVPRSLQEHYLDVVRGVHITRVFLLEKPDRPEAHDQSLKERLRPLAVQKGRIVQRGLHGGPHPLEKALRRLPRVDGDLLLLRVRRE